MHLVPVEIRRGHLILEPWILGTGCWVWVFWNPASPPNCWAIAPATKFFPYVSGTISATLGQFLRTLSPFFFTFSSFKGHSSSFKEAMLFLPLRIPDIVFEVLLPCRVSVSFKSFSFAGSSGLCYSTRLWSLQVPWNWESCQMHEITKNCKSSQPVGRAWFW